MKHETVQLSELMKQRTVSMSEPHITHVERTFSRSFLKYVHSHILILLLGSTFLMGTLIGSILSKNASPHSFDILNLILGGFFEERQTASFSAMAVSTFFSIFSTLILLFFCGFCTISQIIIFIVPLFKGLGYGLSVGTLYSQNGANAVKYVVLLIFPGMLMSTLLLICASKTSFIHSLRLLRNTMNKNEQHDNFRTKQYCIRFVAYLILTLAISVLDSAVYYYIGGT